MESLRKIVRAIPWWGWLIVIAVVYVAWQSYSGWAMSKKLYGMALKQLGKESADVTERKDEWIKTCEEEIKWLGEEKEQAIQDKLFWRQKSIESRKEVAQLKENNDALKKKLASIIISGDLDRIILDLNQRGLSSIRRRGSRPN